jgi:ComF family protein
MSFLESLFFIKNQGCALFDAFLNLFHPPFCSFCKTFTIKKEQILCNTCVIKIALVPSKSIEITSTHAMVVHAIGEYENPLKKMILAKGHSDIATSRQLGQLAAQRMVSLAIDFDYIVPVPLHWTRYAKRGYNQSFEIATMISKTTNKKVVDVLKRTKATRHQSEFDFAGRLKNVTEAFEIRSSIDKDLFKGKKILLIDDLMTTGATIKMAAKELLLLKPTVITSFVISRTK